jgi:hypothetical protein
MLSKKPFAKWMANPIGKCGTLRKTGTSLQGEEDQPVSGMVNHHWCGCDEQNGE